MDSTFAIYSISTNSSLFNIYPENAKMADKNAEFYEKIKVYFDYHIHFGQNWVGIDSFSESRRKTQLQPAHEYD